MTFYLFFDLIGDNLSLMTCLNFASLLFVIGLVGIIWNKKNFLLLLLSIEIMFFSLALNFVFFSLNAFNNAGMTYALLVVIAAAAETSLGLALLLVIYRLGHKADYNTLLTLRG